MLDRSVLEVFLNNGEEVGTMTFFTEGMLDTVVIGTRGMSEGVEVQAEVWGLRSGWEGTSNGTGGGNVTVGAMAGQRVRRDGLAHLR